MQVIHDEVQQLLVAEHIFWGTQKMIKHNKKLHKPSAYYQYMGDAHASMVLTGIRRQIKIDSQSISLARLLSEIRDNCEKISRDYYRELYVGSTVEDLAGVDFDRLAGKGSSHYLKNRATRDLNALKSRARECEAFADRRIAHRDTREPTTVPTFSNASRAIKLMDRLWCKYNLLLNANHTDTLMPTFQYDWAEAFNVPWRKKRAL
jgi:hypothetical protein